MNHLSGTERLDNRYHAMRHGQSKANEAGATHLVIGRFHKMSTLIQQANFVVIDVKARKVVFDRHISFRGDNDEAWRRAESFLARQILEQGEWSAGVSAATALPRSP